MGREVDVRSRPPVPLERDWEWWVDYPHRLAARVRTDRTVVELGRWELAPGLHGSVVRRLKPRPPAWRRRAGIGTALGLVGLALLWLAVGVLLGLLELVAILWPAALAVGVAWVGLRLTTGHRATCAGLHCPGCRG